MIFVPKLKFQRECRKGKDSDKLPRTVISGLSGVDIALPPAGFCTETFCENGPPSGDVNDGCLNTGEMILTSKTPPELVEEVNILKYVAVMNKKTIQDQETEIAELRGLLNKINGVSPPHDDSTQHDVSVHEEDIEGDAQTNKPDESCTS
jgi:hypothetical protein